MYSFYKSSFVILFIFPFIVRLISYYYAVIPPNVEFITACSCVVSAVGCLRNQYPWYFPFLIILTSDFIIGNDAIAIFTLSSWLIIGLFIVCLRSFLLKRPLQSGIIVALFASIFFFLWTNFGVWYLSHGRWYTFDISGLYVCYIQGLPFFRNMLLSNIVFCPLFLLTTKMILKSNCWNVLDIDIGANLLLRNAIA